MAVVLKNKAVFLHIPKTGGTWVEWVLEECGLIKTKIHLKHADIDRLMVPSRLNKVGTASPFIFTFVRNPLDWYESWYRYNRFNKEGSPTYGSYDYTRGRFKDWHPNRVINGCVVDDFNDTVSNIYDIRPGYVTEMYGWYTDPNMVNFVGKTENLRKDLCRVLDEMGLGYNKDTILNSDERRVSKGPQVEWDSNLRKQVKLSEHASFIRYGYV